MAGVKIFPKWVSAAEVAAFYALVHGVMWLSGRFRPTILLVAAAMAVLCVGSNRMHGDTRERLGFDPRHFWPSFRLTALVTLPVLIPLLILGWTKRSDWPWNLPFALAGYPVWSFVQEYALLGFVNNRLEEAMAGHERLLPWINGFLFSMAHLPNPVLMVATFLAGVAFTWIFRRERHLVPISIAHAAVGIAISLAFADIYGIMSVGPGYGARIGQLPLTN
jgi:hypothetical protein